MLQDSSYTKVTDFDLATLRHKYILGLKVTMQNFSVVNVLNGKCHLDKPIKNLIFTIADYIKRKGALVCRGVIKFGIKFQLTSSDFFLVCDFSVQISSISVVHNDAETALIHKWFLICNNVWVPHSFENMDLKKEQMFWTSVNHSKNMAQLSKSSPIHLLH